MVEYIPPTPLNVIDHAWNVGRSLSALDRIGFHFFEMQLAISKSQKMLYEKLLTKKATLEQGKQVSIFKISMLNFKVICYARALM